MQPVDPKTTLGVPVLPPAILSVAGTRLRGALGRIHRAMAPPPVQILEAALSLLDHRVLVALCDAGVPEALTSKLTIDELADRLDIDQQRLERLLRFGAAKGWLRIDRRGLVRPNAVTEFLRSNHPGGWRRWVDFVAGDEIVRAVAALDCTSGDGFAATNGEPFFEWMEHHPDRWSTFDDAMAAGARMHALTLDAAIDWNGADSLCDVGGGTGELARVMLDRHPDWRAVVFDLPEVIDRAVEHPRLEAIGGDAFVEVPSGFDVYLLVNVLHDWNDDACVWLLTNTAAAHAGARIIVVESNRTTVPRDDIAIRADVLMAALTSGGQERSTEQFAALGRRAGLDLVRTTPLVSGDVAHEFKVE
ncbi:MAG: methyltransferase [Acidimicrobiales bacterium]